MIRCTLLSLQTLPVFQCSRYKCFWLLRNHVVISKRIKQRMVDTLQKISNVITLRGSTDIVTEFFDYSINSILYQRGIYPPESFKRVSKYGLAMMQSTDETLRTYLNNILKQLDGKFGCIHFLLSVCFFVVNNQQCYVSLVNGWKCRKANIGD